MKKVVLVAHCAELLALSVWAGGLIAIIATVIPAVFNSANMEIGGRLLTRTFHGYDWLVLSAAAVIIVGISIRSFATRWSEQVQTADVIILASMIAIAVFLAFFWNPRMVTLQERAFLATDPALKQRALQDFFSGHNIARTLYIVNLGLAIVCICRKVWRWGK